MNEHLLPPYQIVELGESATRESFLKIEVRLHGRREQRLLAMRDLQQSADEAISQLGAPLLTRSAKNSFLEEAQRALQTIKPTFRVATEPGWSRKVFILPDGTCVPPEDDVEVYLPHEFRPYAGSFGCSGTLSGWKRIPQLAKGNSRLMLAVSLAFVGPVVDLLRVEPPMVQLFGAPGSGKTSIGAAAGSAWGGGSDGLYLQSWNNTPNNAERMAAAFHATFLVLDETRTADQSQAGRMPAILQLVMRLAGGQVRGRLTDVAAPLRFDTPILSLSNESLDEMARKAGVEIDDAHRGRLIDVPLAPSAVGAFEDLHGFENHADFSIELRQIAQAHHGRAARQFMRRFAADLRRDRDGIVRWLADKRDLYLKHVRERIRSPYRDLERVHQKFATIYAAGRLAIRCGVLPWEPMELAQALVACERAHVDHVAQFVRASSRARQAAPIVVDPLERLRNHVRRNRSKFVDLRRGLIARGSNDDHASCPGFVNRGPDGSVEMLFSNALLLRLCGGYIQRKRLKEELEENGWLLRDSHRRVTRRAIWKDRPGRVHVTAVREEAFEDQ